MLKKIVIFTMMLIFVATNSYAATAVVSFSAPPTGAETWVFVGTKDCMVQASGVILPADRVNCPYGQIGKAGETSVSIGNVPPGVTIYATAQHVYPATGVTSTFAQVVSSAVPPLALPTAPVPFPAPVIIQWPTGSMTIINK